MPWEIMPDLLFYRDPKAVVKEENKRAENEQVIKSGSDLSYLLLHRGRVGRTGLLTVSLLLPRDRGLVRQHRDH